MSVNVITRERDVPTVVVVNKTVVCDGCGCEAIAVKEEQELFCGETPEGEPVAAEFCHISYEGGWDNWVVGDMNCIEIDLCQHCMDKLIEGLKHKPIVHWGGDDVDWEEWKQRRPEWRH